MPLDPSEMELQKFVACLARYVGAKIRTIVLTFVQQTLLSIESSSQPHMGCVYMHIEPDMFISTISSQHVTYVFILTWLTMSLEE